jgi:NADPH:quinone reductase-like Zn-dependent oxidoreductase
MQAVSYKRYGPPEVLELKDVARPEPGSDEVLIRVRAVEVTKGDCEMRSFHFAVKWFWLPLRLIFGVLRPRRQVLGSYFAGEIVAVGESVTEFAPGEAVFGATGLRLGAYAEFLALPARSTIVSKPVTMSFAEAAAVPLGGLNALHFLRLARISPGDALVINGAGGSIGTHAVQIAKAMGAHVTCVDRADKESVLRRLGADEFIDYRSENFATSGRRWDVIFDMVPGSRYRDCIAALRSGGRYLSGNPRFAVMLRSLLTSWFTNKTATVKFAGETREELKALRDMIDAGTLGSIVDRVLPLTDVVAAHRLVEAEQRVGAIVLSVP